MVGQHAHGAVHPRICVVGTPRGLFGPCDERAEAIGLKHRLLVLKDRGQALKACAGVDVLRGQGGERAVLGAVVLHEHQVPELEKAIGARDGATLGAE